MVAVASFSSARFLAFFVSERTRQATIEVRPPPSMAALVDEGLLHAATLPGDLVQQGDAGGVLVRGGREHDDRDDEPQHVHGQASLPARHPFRGIPACRRGRDSDGHMAGWRWW